MLLLIPLLPLAGFLVNASVGRRLSKTVSGAVACAAMLVSFAVSLIAVSQLVALPPESRVIAQTVFSWIRSGEFHAAFTLRLDPLASLMILESVKIAGDDYATDPAGHSANTTVTLYVNSSVSVVLSAPSPNNNVAPGTPVSLTAYAYGFSNPVFSVTDSLNGTSVSNSLINSSGMFSWTPTANDAGNHTLTFIATDQYG